MKKKITNEEIMEKLKEIEKKIDRQPIVIPIQPYIPQVPTNPQPIIPPYSPNPWQPVITWCGGSL